MKKLLLLVTVLLLCGCPDENDCDDLGIIAYITDLVKISPIQSQYSEGDLITITASIPASNAYFGSEANILNATGDNFGRLYITAGNLFDGNDVIYLRGFEDGNFNWFAMPYDPITASYEVKIQLRLNRIGTYNINPFNNIEFIGNGCNRYFIETTFEWIPQTEIIFEVIP